MIFADTTTDNVFFQDAGVLLQSLQRPATDSYLDTDLLAGVMDNLTV